MVAPHLQRATPYHYSASPDISSSRLGVEGGAATSASVSASSGSRLSVHQLLRGPDTSLTLAPAYIDGPSPIDTSISLRSPRSSPVATAPAGLSPGYGRGIAHPFGAGYITALGGHLEEGHYAAPGNDSSREGGSRDATDSADRASDDFSITATGDRRRSSAASHPGEHDRSHSRGDKFGRNDGTTKSSRKASRRKPAKTNVAAVTKGKRANSFAEETTAASPHTMVGGGSSQTGALKGGRNVDNDNWGFPPPNPSPGLFQGYPPLVGQSGHAETSASGAKRASIGSPGHGGPAGTGGKRRRESDADFGGSAEPEDENGVRPLAITCAPCRTRKIKCDSKKPVCANCTKHPAECYYPVKLKPGLRPGTGTDMVKRLENLEERIQSYEIRLADQETRLTQVQFAAASNVGSSLNAPLSASSMGPASSSSQQQMLPAYIQTPGSGTFMQTLSGGMELSGMPSSTGSGMSSLGGQGANPNTLAMSNMAGPATATAGGSTGAGGGGMISGVGVGPTQGTPSGGGPLDLASFGPSASPSGLSTHSFRDPQVLPPDDIVRDLIGLFFTFVHPWAPILSPSIPSFASPWSIVVHAMVVVAMRYSNDPRLTHTKSSFRQAAKQHVLAHAIESTSISSVQALAILALDLIGSEQGPSSWGILALLTRSAVHLGLAVEDDASGLSTSSNIGTRAPAPSLSKTSIIPPAVNWAEDEARRRLFWLIFCLDRYACVSTGWDFAIPDFEVKRRLPCSDEIWANSDWHFTPLFRPVTQRDFNPDTSTLSPLAHLVEALDLLGRAHTLQAGSIEPGDGAAVELRKDRTLGLTRAAQGWFRDAVAIREGQQNGLTLMIQAIHHATLLKLNAYYAYPALSTGEAVEPHTSTCLAATSAIVSLISTARSVGWMSASTPYFIWGSWVAARVLFVHAFLAHRLGPDDDFDGIVASLKEQAGYWGLANQYVKLLERAKRKWLAAITDAPNPSLPDAIHVLLDLRRTAYSAVNTNAQETPHVSPPDLNLSHLPAWAVQPLLGDLHNWFDLPAGLYQGDI